MNIYQARRIFEAVMTDRCDIYRHKNVKNIDGSTDTILDNEPIYTNVKCRVSFIRYKIENPADITIDDNPIKVTPKIFFPVFTDVKAGDVLKIIRYSPEKKIMGYYSGILGLPAYYDTHIEIMLSMDTSA